MHPHRLKTMFAATLTLLLAAPMTHGPANAQDASAAVARHAPAIRVVAAERRELVETLDVTGTVLPRQEAAVGVDVGGLIVVDLSADKGDLVKKGDVLARLDPTALETQLAQADASRAQAQASIAQAQAQVSDAEIGVRQASEALERARTLQGKGVSTQAQLDNAVNGFDSANAKLETTRRAVEAAQSQLAVIAAQRRDIEQRLAKTVVKAPADGLVLARNATLGGIVSASGGALFRIAIDGDLELAATVSETALPRLKTGMKAIVDVPGVAPLDGTIRMVDPEIDQKSRLGTIRISLPKHDNVRPGNFARGAIETLRSDGIAVPVSALVYKGGDAFVQRVVDGTIQTVEVKLGARAEDAVELVEGLAEGDEVVSRAGTFVADGDHVTPVRELTTGALAR